MFKKTTQENLYNKTFDSSDRTYIVRVLSTLLLTHVSRPSMKDCEIVAKSLVLKYSFFKEHVRFYSDLYFINFYYFDSIPGSNTFMYDVRILIENLNGPHQMTLLALRKLNVPQKNMLIHRWLENKRMMWHMKEIPEL